MKRENSWSMMNSNEKWPSQPNEATEYKLGRFIRPPDDGSEYCNLYSRRSSPIDDLPLGPYIIFLDYLDVGMESILNYVLNIVPRFGSKECLRVTLLSDILLGEEWAIGYVKYLCSKSEEEISGMYEACCYMRAVDVHRSVRLVTALLRGNPHYDPSCSWKYDSDHGPISHLVDISTGKWSKDNKYNTDVILYGHYVELGAVSTSKISVTRTVLNGDSIYKNVNYGKPTEYLLEAALRCVQFARCDCEGGILLSGKINEKIFHDCGYSALRRLLQYYRDTYPSKERRDIYHQCMWTVAECGRLEMFTLVKEIYNTTVLPVRERSLIECCAGSAVCGVIKSCIRYDQDIILPLYLAEGRCRLSSMEDEIRSYGGPKLRAWLKRESEKEIDK